MRIDRAGADLGSFCDVSGCCLVEALSFEKFCCGFYYPDSGCFFLFRSRRIRPDRPCLAHTHLGSHTRFRRVTRHIGLTLSMGNFNEYFH